MTDKLYQRPSHLKQFCLRYKRRTPGWVVDGIDSLYRLRFGKLLLNYPYCSSTVAYSPFFIMGCGRSGTTLLRKLLMENADVSIPPEIPGLGSTIREFSRVGSANWSRIVVQVLLQFYHLANADRVRKAADGGVVRYNLADELSLDFEALKIKLLALPENERSLEAIIVAIYESFTVKKYGRNLPWGDKTAWSIFHYDRIKKVFPHAKYIHMLRDGRDCVASYVESFNMHYINAAYRWRDSVKQIKKIAAENAERFMEVRYEELVQSPEQIVTKVINFLHLDHIKQQSMSVELLGDGNALHHKNLVYPVNTVSIGKWKDALTKHEKWIVLRIIGQELRSFQYLT